MVMVKYKKDKDKVRTEIKKYIKSIIIIILLFIIVFFGGNMMEKSLKKYYGDMYYNNIGIPPKTY